jgi:hypothetical protein
MGKGSGACKRPSLELVNEDTANLSAEKNPLASLDFTLRMFNSGGGTWNSSDNKVSFHRELKEWIVLSNDDDLETIMEQAGLNNDDPPLFPTLKEAREAIQAVAGEAGINLSSTLTRPPGSKGCQIGDLPFNIFRDNQENKAFWGLAFVYDTELPNELRPYFPGGAKTLETVWNRAGLELKKYPTRKQAIQEVKDWLEEYVQNVKS